MEVLKNFKILLLSQIFVYRLFVKLKILSPPSAAKTQGLDKGI